MNESTSNQLNDCDLDDSSKTHQFDEISYVVDEKFVPKVGMIFKTLEEARKFYKHYFKLADFSTKIRNTTRDGDKIKNQIIVCSSEGRWKSKISPTLKTNPSAGLNCPARIYVHIMKDVGLWTIFKVVLDHSHPCCPDQAYQSFVATTGSHRELGFIEKDIKNYSTREVRNISEEDDAKEFGKYLVRMKEKNQNFFFALNLEGNNCIKHAFWAYARSRAAFDYFGDVVSFDTTYNTNRYNLVLGSCVLMRNEDVQSFKWLFDCWLRCMGGKAPKEAFDRNSIDFLGKYGLESNKWLSELYADRHIWIPVYLDPFLGRDEKHTKEEVQVQFRGKVNCITRSMHSTLGFTTYEVIEQSKNIKRRHTHIKSSQDEPLLEPRSKRFDELVFWSHNICEFASESEELIEILHRAFDKVMAEMEEYQERSKGKSLLTYEEVTLSNVNDLQSPPCVKTRGRPMNRLGSNLEKKISNAIK
ncbi:hypothetical protein Ahy_A08g037809 [Arachis hypogaea]|uniref:FAR1 domain-containing protein n=1 Tax=Arachis hypogaea TaxID=3818 RepID=A0A445BS12_ARAHY|nr:hypothetical protein Ahy_A08g037809 [Arachis hypogaea]